MRRIRRNPAGELAPGEQLDPGQIAFLIARPKAGEAAAELWLDWRLLPLGIGLESRLSRLAGWVLAAERAGMQYGLRLPGVEVAPGRGDAHRADCLKALALYEAT